MDKGKRINIKEISNTYDVVGMTKNNTEEIYNLCIENTLYYDHFKEEVSVKLIENDLLALPPNKTLNDKYYLGFYKDNILIAIMDLIMKYPNDNTAYIGFFMMNTKLQGQGIGTKIIDELMKFLKTQGITHARLGYIKTNEQPKHFWEKNKFTPTGIESDTDKFTVVVMERSL